MNKILIGLSWPYSNNELHIGHLGSSLPADILARYYRLKGKEVCFVSGSDCYGTPISIQAQIEGKSPHEIAETYHEKFVSILRDLNFSFDNYSHTIKDSHLEFARKFHEDLYNTDFVCRKEKKRLYCNSCKRFLPDRYVVGLCPNCGHQTKGDSCDKCGKVLEPEELVNPKCNICGDSPVFKDNFQFYIRLSKLEKSLKDFFDKRKDKWSINAINLTNRYFEEGLIDRAISRDLDWGIPVPVDGLKNKVIYNWGENVLGYLSACKEWCEKNGKDFRDWSNGNGCEHIFVHAKDNIQFHSIIYPALLIANPSKYHLPDKIFAFEYVTNEGQKISKSKGTCLTARQLLSEYNVHFLRYYFAKNISDRKDLDFNRKEFIDSINGELINNWGNFVNRSLAFVKNKFNGKISKSEKNEEVRNKIAQTFKKTCSFIESGKVSSATKEIFELVNFANKYFNQTEPWKIINENKEKCEGLSGEGGLCRAQGSNEEQRRHFTGAGDKQQGGNNFAYDLSERVL